MNIFKINKPDNWQKFIFDMLFIIGTLALLVFSGYQIGHRNGRIKECLSMGNLKLQNGSCVPEKQYYAKIEEMNAIPEYNIPEGQFK